MIIQHDILAMNTARQLGIATKTKAKKTEWLSSGYRINRAADDGEFKIEFSDEFCPIKIFYANHGDPNNPDDNRGKGTSADASF